MTSKDQKLQLDFWKWSLFKIDRYCGIKLLLCMYFCPAKFLNGFTEPMLTLTKLLKRWNRYLLLSDGVIYDGSESGALHPHRLDRHNQIIAYITTKLTAMTRIKSLLVSYTRKFNILLFSCIFSHIQLFLMMTHLKPTF